MEWEHPRSIESYRQLSRTGLFTKCFSSMKHYIDFSFLKSLSIWKEPKHFFQKECFRQKAVFQ